MGEEKGLPSPNPDFCFKMMFGAATIHLETMRESTINLLSMTKQKYQRSPDPS